VVEPEQMRLAAFSAVAAGARGLCFRSRSRLDATNAVGRLRAATVELINRELAALEPWAAGGAGAAGVATSVDDVRVAVISTERSRLLIPLHAPDNAQHACGAPPPGEVAFVVPGVPDDFNAYELTPAGLRPLRRQRWPGGVRITRDGSQLGWPVVLTQDPLVVSRLARDLTANGPRLSRLRRELAAGWLQLAQQVAQQLPTKGDEQIDVAPLLAQAESHLRQADQLLAHGDDAAAAQAADRALQNLAQVRRALWQRHAAEFPDPLASPCCVQFSTLPSHRQLAATLRAGRGGPNLLPGGDFENLQQMLSAGWQQVQTPADGVKTHVELTRQAPVAGQYVLRLSAWVDDGSAQNRVVETLPVHVTSAPATVHPGQVVRIHGWVRIAEPIAGSGHGLVISDSLAGDDLALRINATGSWREFTLYRAAEQSGQVTITFALTGLGVVDLDQVTITTITPAPLAAQPRSPGR